MVLLKTWQKITGSFVPKEKLIQVVEDELAQNYSQLPVRLQNQILDLEPVELATIIANGEEMSLMTVHSLKKLLLEAGVVEKWLAIMVTSKSEVDRLMVIEALGALKVSQASYPLLEALADKSAMIQLAAAGALVKLQNRQLIPLLIDGLKTKKWPPAHVARILLDYPEQIIKPVVDFLNGDGEQRLIGVQVLSQLQKSEVLEDLIKCLNDPMEAVRGEAIYGLSQMPLNYRGAECTQKIVPLLEDESWQVRLQAARYMGKAQADGEELNLTELLEPLLNDDNPKVVAVAAEVMSKGKGGRERDGRLSSGRCSKNEKNSSLRQ